MYPTYLLTKCVSSLVNGVDDTVPKEPKINMFLKTICEIKFANVLTLCYDQTLKKQGTQYNKSRCILD